MQKLEMFGGMIEGVGHVRECVNCHGEGYIQIASTAEPGENDYEVCGECDGEGLVDTFTENEDYIHNGDN